MYYDTPEVLEALKHVPPPTGWAGFKYKHPQLASEAEYMMKRPNGIEIAVWDADGRLKRGTVVEYSFQDAEDREGTETFREKVSDDFELADWLMEYGY